MSAPMIESWPGPLEEVAVGDETQHVTCDQRGCTILPTIRCVFPDDSSGGYYCQAHCSEAGFCWGCGLFWAGIERFDFAVHYGGIEGLCENCEDQFRADVGDYIDDDVDEADVL